MTLQELKQQHPDLCAQLIAEGATQEKERVTGFLAWLDTDKDTVLASIKDGKQVTPSAISEFSAKAATTQRISAHTSDNLEDVETPEAKTEREALEAIAKEAEAEVYAGLGIK